MSTQRVLLMLFVTVAVSWMVGYAEGKHAADLWWQANWNNYARSGSHWSDDTDKFACPGKGPKDAQELAWWRAHATPEHPCQKEQPQR